MTQRVVHRPERLRPPPPPMKPIELATPPAAPESGAALGGATQVLLPALGAGGSLVMILANRNPLMIVAGGAMMVAMVIGGLLAFIAQRTGAARRTAVARERYVEYLGDVRTKLVQARQQQQQFIRAGQPAPLQLPELIRDPSRLWERRRHDPDFLVVRIGTGSAPLFSEVRQGSPANPMIRSDAVAVAAIDRLRITTAAVDNVPLSIPLAGVVSIIASTEVGYAAVRAMMVQIAASHAPDDVRIGLCLGPHAVPEFEWAKWLPHLMTVDGFDGPVGQRLVARTTAELQVLLGREIEQRHAFVSQQRRSGSLLRVIPTPRIVLFADQTGAARIDPFDLEPEGGTLESLGITLVTLNTHRQHEPSSVTVRVTISADGAVIVENTRPEAANEPNDAAKLRRLAAGATHGELDFVSPSLAMTIARMLAPLRLVEDAVMEAPLEATIELAEMAGVRDVGTYTVTDLWQPRLQPDFLRVPIGVDNAGKRVFLDIKESAQNGMGPHGICIGATGSGKSEVLRTIVLTMAMTHPPERLSFVLVDYKGGATFASLGDLPHTAAMVTNLSNDTGLVDRLHDALLGETERRQQVLQNAGSLPNVAEYNARRDAGYPLAALPNLFVVIDEFGEMLTAKPDFIELFLRIGRIGRSIGVHLLLASQRLEEGRLRGLESYLSYRIGLRTFNAQESRAVLGVPDAHELPPIPGSGYLKVDPDIFVRFKATYVSATYQPADVDESLESMPAIAMPYQLCNDTGGWLAEVSSTSAGAQERAPEDRFAPSVLEVATSRISKAAEQVAQIWLPPLPAALPLNRVLEPDELDPAKGRSRHRKGGLRIPMGLLDKPAQQWQGPLVLDLSSGGGHVAVMGAPQSGKSTALRTIIAASALTHTPREMAFYCLDLGGGGLSALADLPHVGGVASKLQPDRVLRTVAEVAAALADRERLFAEYGFDSVEALREAHRAGQLPTVAAADIFLVIDGWSVLREEFEEQAELVQELGGRGLGYGVHLIIATGRWADFRLPTQSIIGTKIELRLNDPLDSTISRHAVSRISPTTPGRAVCFDGLHAQLCLPRIDNREDTGSSQDGLSQLVKDVVAAWPEAPVPEIRMLPTYLDYAAFRRQHPFAPPVLLGVEESALQPVRLDLFGTDQHLLVFGDTGSGKTTLARLLVRELIDHFTDEKVVFAVFDVRRTLLDVVPEAYRGGYAGAPNIAAGLGQGLAKEIANRMPPGDITTAQLRERSWWRGPEIVVLVDDYDLMAPAGPGPLAPLMEFLPQSRDLGLHVVLLRRSGGAGRALHEPVIQRLKEIGATGLLLSGERQEGQIWPGVHMASLPPGRGLLVRRGSRPHRVQLASIPDF